LNEVLFVGRPSSDRSRASVGLFKVDPDGSGAARVQVSSDAAP